MKKNVAGFLAFGFLLAISTAIAFNGSQNENFKLLTPSNIEALSRGERVCYYDNVNQNGRCYTEVGTGANGASCVDGSFGTKCTGTTTI